MDSHYPARIERMLFILRIIRGRHVRKAAVRRGRLDDDLTTHRDTNIIKEDFLVFFLSFFLLSFLFLIHIFF